MLNNLYFFCSDCTLIILLCTAGLPVEDKRPRELIVQEQLLHYLESAYPNVLPTDELAE